MQRVEDCRQLLTVLGSELFAPLLEYGLRGGVDLLFDELGLLFHLLRLLLAHLVELTAIVLVGLSLLLLIEGLELGTLAGKLFTHLLCLSLELTAVFLFLPVYGSLQLLGLLAVGLGLCGIAFTLGDGHAVLLSDFFGLALQLLCLCLQGVVLGLQEHGACRLPAVAYARQHPHHDGCRTHDDKSFDDSHNTCCYM